jgi:hypothetical protein
MNSINPILDQSEARAILRDGYVDLDIHKKIQPVVNPKPISDPNIEPQPVKKPEKQEFKQLTPMQRKMIEREHELGERELQEQEYRIALSRMKKGQNTL